MQLQDRNILIIGGNSGIGKAIADSATAQGATVYYASRNAEGERSTRIDTNHPFTFPEGFLPDKLHGLVYCPGSINLKPINRLTPEMLIEEFTLNVAGAYRCLQAALRPLKQGGDGSVVFFSTVAAKIGMPFHASIAAAKGGLEAMSRALAAELAVSHIRVNLVAPSLTDTPLAAALLDNPEKRANSDKRHPLGRVGTPQDIAEAALYLLSPAAAWVTGQVIGVDGGMGSIK